ncbi:hypothetical protein BC833DRAFT_612099 [Globomyces pollinis-pini]|nr:hypothetical protein BC833DRAFT_612099 [Globomyces pollinis-pini]
MKSKKATLKDFTNFHGMLILPDSASKCVEAFTNHNATILFMPRNFNSKKLENYHIKSLTLFSYYSLVLASLTGLSTLINLTHFFKPLEDFNGLNTKDIDENILDFISHQSSVDINHLKVIRKFEYTFYLPNLHVVMYHVLDGIGNIHLVEIYESATTLKFIYTIILMLLIGVLFQNI